MGLNSAYVPYIPGIQLKSPAAMDFAINAEDSEQADLEASYMLHIKYNGNVESIMVFTATTADEIAGAILSLVNLRLEDMQDEKLKYGLTIWDNSNTQVIGALKENSKETPYTVRFAEDLNEESILPLFNQIKNLSAKIKKMDMDKVLLDGSIYHQVPQQTQYVEKYQFSETIKEALKTATFNNWEYEENELVSLVIHMYVELRIPEHFKIELQTLHNFVTRVRENYNNNPFHCFKHGFCVFQMAYALIHATGFVNEISMLEKLILLTACIGHDLDHPGYNNAYQINAKTDLATIYNDSAPLENHHSAVLFAILNLESCNLLRYLDHQSFSAVRKGIIRCIMATDMAKHGEHLQIFSKIIPTFNLSDAEHRAQLMSIFIKCADISTEVRPPHVADVWVNRLLEEFFCQSDREKIEGLPFLPFMDRDKVTKPGAQVGFLSFVVVPLYEALGKVYPTIEPEFIGPIKKSLEYYKGLQGPAK